MSIFYTLQPTISKIADHIQKEMGGIVEIVDNDKLNHVTFKWTKYDQATNQELHFDYIAFYLELEQIADPLVLAEAIVDLYTPKENS